VREINELLYIFEKSEGMLKAPAIIIDMSSTFLTDISKRLQFKFNLKLRRK